MPISDYSNEPAVLRAHACRLCAPGLVNHGSTPLDSDLLSPRNEADRLAGLLRRDLPRLAFEDARRWAARAIRDAPREWDSLGVIARRCVCLEAGRPAASIGPLEDQLRRIVQADALVCWHLAQRGWSPSEPGVRARLDWSSPLPPARSVVDPVLGRSMAENHCHLGSAVGTGAMWVFALVTDDRAGCLFPRLRDASAQELWDRHLLTARLDVLLIEALTRPGGPITDEAGLRSAAPVADLLELRRVLGWAVPQQLEPASDHLLHQKSTARQEHDSEVLRWPLGEWVIGGKASLSVLAGERLLVWRALRELPRGTGDSSWRSLRISEALLSYLRIKNAFHQMLLLSEHGRGFFAFDQTFKRRSFLSSPTKGHGPARVQMSEALERRRMSLAIDAFLEDALGHGGPSRLAYLPELDLELRVAPESGPVFVRMLRGWLRGIRDAMCRWGKPPLRVGLVLHAIKTDKPTWWENLRVQMEGLRFMMADRPGLCRLIVGIDVAGVERQRPPRECAPFYRTIRREVQLQDPAAAPFAWRPGFTVHVGEDFPDLLTGLRHIDEATHLLGLRANDRLGHALALGWDIDQFYDTVQGPCVSLRERVLDLLWLLYLAAQVRDGLREQAFWLRRTVASLVSELRSGDDGAASGALVDAAVDRIGRHYRQEGGCGEAELLEMLGIPSGRWEDEIAVPVGDSDHRRCVHEARRIVWKRVHDKSLFIEGNPTSNLIIGGLDGYAELPLMRLGKAPGVVPIDGLPALRITINTDNPGIFNTTLRSEYVRVGQALLESGSDVDAADVSSWLDTIRVNGLAASFIPDNVPRGKRFVDLLDQVLAD